MGNDKLRALALGLRNFPIYCLMLASLGCGRNDPVPAPTQQTAKADSTADDALYERGVEALRNDDLPRATADLTAFIERHPKDVDARIKVGLAAFQQDQFEWALNIFTAAQEIDPGNSIVRQWRSDTLYRVSRPDDTGAAKVVPHVVERIRELCDQAPQRKIPTAPDALIEQSYHQQHYEWLKARYCDQFERSCLADPDYRKWHEPARSLLNLAIQSAAGIVPQTTLDQLERAGKTAIDAGCRDPLVFDVYSLVLYLACKDVSSEDFHARAVTGFAVGDYRDRGVWDTYIELGSIPITRNQEEGSTHPWFENFVREITAVMP